MKILSLLLFIQFQLDTIPSLEQLYTCLETHHEASLEAALAEYQETTKGEWLKYIPSVGVTYTLNNQPRPSVSLSSSVLYQARKAKQLRAAKRTAIQKTNILNLRSEQLQIRDLVEKYETAKGALQLAIRIHQIDSLLFEIDQAKYEALEIAPSERLKIQRNYLLKQYELVAKKREVQAIRREILLYSKCYN